MSKIQVKEPLMLTHVTNVGTRSFCPLDAYLKANSLPEDDPFVHHNWFPLYVSFQQELEVKKELEEHDFDTFIPMTVKFEKSGSRIKRTRVPAIHNIIFVNSYYERIRWMKMYNPICCLIQFMSHGKLLVKDTIIPDLQMEQFVKACNKAEGKEHVVYLKPEEIKEYQGKAVRFVDGDFIGIEGYIQRINNNKMVVVTLRGIQSIALPVSRRDEFVFIEKCSI